ncbi:MAG: alpha/beta fold hydrolase [Patescibacteria group bacterium]
MYLKIFGGFVLFLALWILSSIVLTLQSNNIVFQPQNSRTSLPKGDYDQQFIKSGKNNIGIRIYPSKSESSKKIYLYMHGNAGRLENFIENLTNEGKVISPAYPGYSESEGNVSQESAFLTAIDTYNYLTNTLQIPTENIIVVGHSLGGSIATYLASQKNSVSKLILINTFSSIQSMCWNNYGILCVFSNGIFNSAQYAKNVKADVIQFGYSDDKTIPYEETEKLSKYFNSAKSYSKIKMEQYGHSYPDWMIIKPYL